MVMAITVVILMVTATDMVWFDLSQLLLGLFVCFD
jgi:hypothetical protein